MVTLWLSNNPCPLPPPLTKSLPSGIENDEAVRAQEEAAAQKAAAQKAKARKTYLDLIKAFVAIPEDKLAGLKEKGHIT